MSVNGSTTVTPADRDSAHLKLYRMFDPKPGPISVDGWLSPEGKFFPCEFRGHDRFARHLTAVLYNSLEGTILLEREGWVRVTNGMFWWSRRCRPTKAQYEAACDLLNEDLSNYVEQSVRMSIRRMEVGFES